MRLIAEACDQHLLRMNVSMHIATDMKVNALQVMDTKLKNEPDAFVWLLYYKKDIGIAILWSSSIPPSTKRPDGMRLLCYTIHNGGRPFTWPPCAYPTVDVQGIVGAVGEPAHEFLELIVDLHHHLPKAETLHSTKLHLLQLQELQHRLEVVLSVHGWVSGGIRTVTGLIHCLVI